ncbi:hypothetical protein ACN28S_16675 [Cystobacter fuscus]
MVLWALEDYREWALRLSSPTLMPLARNAFELLSSNRRRLSGWLHLEDEAVRQHRRARRGRRMRPNAARTTRPAVCPRRSDAAAAANPG